MARQAIAGGAGVVGEGKGLHCRALLVLKKKCSSTFKKSDMNFSMSLCLTTRNQNLQGCFLYVEGVHDKLYRH